MKCRFCGNVVKGKLGGSDIHRKCKEWVCGNCGLIKAQWVVDGEVMRSWVKK